MEVLRFIVLGIVQGFTEFLPISSSGHLVIFQDLLGVKQPGIVLEVILHAGTLLSIIYYYRSSIFKKDINYWVIVAVATIPAVAIGLILNSRIESIFENLRLVGIALIFTGVINFLTTKIQKKGGKLIATDKIKIENIKNTLVIGIFQALAIIPGISRSGSTIFAGRRVGLSRRSAAEFSFLMSIPAVLGANIYELVTNTESIGQINRFYMLGFLASFFAGVTAIELVIKFLEKADYRLFSYYALIVGLLVIIIS